MESWLGKLQGIATSRLWQAARWLKGNPRWLVVAGIVAWGSVLRFRGYFVSPIPLWEDEAAWTIHLIERPLSEYLIRPLGFMAISKLLINVLSPSELVLRALPWVGGMAGLLLSPFLAERLFRSWAARLMFVAIVALHPAAIDLAKEFKPYSLAFGLHIIFLFLTLRYVSEGRFADLAWGIGLGTVGVLLSHDTVFAYPALFGVLGMAALGRARLHVVAVVVSAVCSLGLLLALRAATSLNSVTSPSEVQYWGKKYDVFYVGAKGQGSSRWGWTAARQVDLAAMVGMRRELWNLRASEALVSRARQADALLWILLSGIGCCVLIYQRRLQLLVLLVSPLAVMTVMNVLGLWPLGAFRTNLFAVVYYAALASSTFEWTGWRRTMQDVLPASLLVLLPFLLLGRSSHARKESTSMADQTSITAAAQKLIEMLGPQASEPALLALDAPSCRPWIYYTKYHPNRARAAELLRRFDAHCTKTAKRMARLMRKTLRTPNARGYLLATGRHMAAQETALSSELTIEERHYIGKGEALVARVVRRPSP